ncbi:copper homeostasis protein CutC [Amycolatopsis thermoflava]|uniref:copper homeostasis protein CutC n=1 Tax=Amycolatopsis thermoflava TaxID=84480 RepID=UPI00040A84AB|nr:copper homeostasis protein CutC [Amycolatopsis thermoflava]
MAFVELSTDTVDGAIAADRLGADRVELCAAGALGGLTPGPGLLAATLARCTRAGVHVLIRPRDGGFRYAPAEVDAMLADVRHAVAAGAAGVVVGALTAAGEVDRVVVGELVAAAGGREVTFHRAIDVCADPLAALEVLAELGVRRVLSSGQAATAVEGAPLLARMTELAGERVTVMACGGIRPHNVRQVLETTGVRHVHAAPRRPAEQVPATAVDFGVHQTLDVHAAEELIAAAR